MDNIKSLLSVSGIPLTMDFYTPEYNILRRLKAIMLTEKLMLYQEFVQLEYSNQIEMIKRIENSCSNETIRKARDCNIRCVWENEQFQNIYHNTVYTIISALDDNDISNTLIKNILNKDIDINSIANLSSKDLSPQKYENIMFEINKRNNVTQTQKYTEMYFCKKCKHNQSTVERVQNRSGDEGSSFFITCTFCGAKWFG
jgi:DNA-directed RNA polymerase subunit M/transcription elongation factor TFIIS